MSEIGQVIVDPVKSWEYIPSNVDVSFDCNQEYRSLYISAKMLADRIFTFYLIGDRTNDYFSLLDDDSINSRHHTGKSLSFNDENLDMSLPELDLSHAYFHWDLSIAADGYVCETMNDKEANYMKEYPLDLTKGSRIVSHKKSVHIMFTSDGENGV
jgi:hypothetical protein